jgi:hypothetical protein
MAEIKALKLSEIQIEGGTQMRTALNSDVLLEYRDKWDEGFSFPPIEVFFDGVNYWPGDGFHRYWSAHDAGRDTIPCKVTNGTKRDAILFACGANAIHGLRRSSADKRKAVAALLQDKEWNKWSDRKIAEHAGVSHEFVSNLRDQLSEIDSSLAVKERTGKDGKVRTVGEKQPKEPPMFDPPIEEVLVDPDERPSAKLFAAAVHGIYKMVRQLDEINMVAPNENLRQKVQDALQEAKDILDRWRKSTK